MNQPGNDREDQRIFLWFAFLIIAFCIVPLLYTAHPDVVNGPLLTLAKAQLKAFTPFGFAGPFFCCLSCSAWPPSSWAAWAVLSGVSTWKAC